MRYVLIAVLALAGCVNSAPTDTSQDAEPVCAEQPDPWPCLRIGSQVSGLMTQLVTAVDTQDTTKTEELVDQISTLGLDYDICLQAYGSEWNWSSP